MKDIIRSSVTKGKRQSSQNSLPWNNFIRNLNDFDARHNCRILDVKIWCAFIARSVDAKITYIRQVILDLLMLFYLVGISKSTSTTTWNIYFSFSKMLKYFVTFLFLEILIISSDGQIPWVIDYKREAKIIREYLQEHRKMRSNRVILQVDHFLSNDKI